jgi:hypothetical protein
LTSAKDVVLYVAFTHQATYKIVIFTAPDFLGLEDEQKMKRLNKARTLVSNLKLYVINDASEPFGGAMRAHRC